MFKFKKILSASIVAVMLVSSIAVVPASAASMAKPKFTLSNTSKGIKISWKKAKGAKKYIISRKLSSAKKYKDIKTVKSAKSGSFVDKGAKSGKKYNYRITSVNGKSKAVSKTMTYVRLVAPTKLKASYFMGAIDLEWKKVPGAKKYDVYRATVSGSKTGAFKKLDITDDLFSDPSDNYFYDETGVPGKSYKYKVRAVNGSSKSEFSSVSKKVDLLPETMINTKLSGDYNGVDIELIPDEYVTKYEIYRKTAGTDFVLIASLTPDELSKDDSLGELLPTLYYTDNNVEVGTEYTYYVKAFIGSVFAISNEETILYQDCDLSIKVGESKKILDDLDDEEMDILDIPGVSITFSYKSDNEDVVTVNDDGLVTGIKVGVANVNVQYTIKMSLQGVNSVQTVDKNFKVKVVE